MTPDVAQFTAVLKHFYGHLHREYPYCPQCVEWNVKSLKARLRAKYKNGAAA